MNIIKNVIVYSNKVFSPKKFLLISDFHLSSLGGFENLDKVKNSVLNNYSFDGLFIPGDIINDLNDLDDSKFKNKFINELYPLIKDKKTFFSLGNHDLMKKDEKKWIPGNENKIIDLMSNFDEVTFIDNESVVNVDEFAIGAFSPNYNYYESTKGDINEFKKQFYSDNKLLKFNDEHFNILMSHDPESIIKLSKMKDFCIQKNTDLVLSGHMHNGMIPNFLCGKSNYGLVSPNRTLFPHYAKGNLNVNNTEYVIAGAVNNRVEWPIINRMYNPSITIINVVPKGKKMIR